jgi:predicted dehydrogenase
MKILLVGYGYWGKIWEKTIQNSEHELHDIIDPHVFQNKIENVDFSTIDSVIICSSIDTHFKLAQYCIEKHKHVLIEKPCTHSLNDIMRLHEMNTTKNIGIGYVLLYCSAIQEIKKIDLCWKNVFFNRSNGSTQIRKDCNVIYDLLCHDLSIAYYMFQIIPTVLYCDKSDDSIFCILNFGGVKCHFYCTRIDTKKQSNCLFVNDKTTYSYDDITKKLIIHDKDRQTTKSYSEYPLENQLRYIENTFLADLSFGVSIHKILSMICHF